jgi:diaminohydroxyphosphoribosylaminopyrimidine deaminase / 5-amino-6-(5-phosphoribosylamino)uracil reductase
MSDERFMSCALALAERGRGRTSPNPMVGAVIVDRDGVIVGRGSHEYAGGPHAEVLALKDAGDRARGATLYCTLEPCSHTGRTGPCAPAVAAAGIARVVVATEDPNPLVAGRGLRLLRAAGIDVVTGVLADAAARLNRPFFSLMRRGRPFVTMKVALSADGRLASAPGVRTAITGSAANRLIHRERAEVDAIGVGSGTVLADDPELTARVAFRARPLTRVVFDRRLRTPPSARLLSTRAAGPVIIICTHASAASADDRVRALEHAGAAIERVDEGSFIHDALRRLAALGVSSLVVEGGAALHRAFWDAGAVDRVAIFIGAQRMGPDGMPWLPLSLLAQGPLTDVTARAVGEDVMIEGYVHRPD